MTCHACGHAVEAHGPYGCLVTDDDGPDISGLHLCRCTLPGPQQALPLWENA